MLAEREIEVQGERLRLVLRFGGLERVAKVNPYLEEVATALRARVWKMDELTAVLDAGLAGGEAQGWTAARLVEALGVGPARDLAAELMRLAWADDAGNSPGAAAAGANASASAPATGS